MDARWLAALLAAALPVAATPTERPVEGARAGRTVVTLDRDVYDRARADLGDLRLVDDRGLEVPFLIDRYAPPPLDELAPVQMSRSRTRLGASAVMDFGRTVLKSSLHLRLLTPPAGERLLVEGRGRHDPAWRVVSQDTCLADPSTDQTVRLPENNFRFLRVTVVPRAAGRSAGPGAAVERAWVGTALQRRKRGEALPVVLERSQEQSATVLTVDLRASHQPFLAVELDTWDQSFRRRTQLEAWSDDTSSWAVLAHPVLYRDVAAGCALTTVETAGRARRLRLRVENGGEPPLTIRGLQVFAPVERVVFEAAAERRYVLRYGTPGLGPPAYDLGRRVGDPAVWAAGAAPARLGPPVADQAPPPVTDSLAPILPRDSWLLASIATMLAASTLATLKGLSTP